MNGVYIILGAGVVVLAVLAVAAMIRHRFTMARLGRETAKMPDRRAPVDADFDGLEKHFGKPIPDDVRWLYGQPDLLAKTGVELRGSVQPDEWYVIDSFVPATVAAATSTWFDIGRDRLPFAIDDAGNYFAVRVGDRNDSEVLYIDHDGNSEWTVAASLRTFLLQEDASIK